MDCARRAAILEAPAASSIGASLEPINASQKPKDSPPAILRADRNGFDLIDRRAGWEFLMRNVIALFTAALAVFFMFPRTLVAAPYPDPDGHPQEYLRWFVQKCVDDNRGSLRQKTGLSGEQIAAYCGCTAGAALSASLVKSKGLDPAGQVTGGIAITYCVSGLAAPDSPKIQP